ncbi:hypothetical protein MLD38_032739 [Melastoma candidum]|uniref:Uncharacterized protein n=1 Tax=Melastoma candidum TaxID=119954 RepID=A0ACB9M878_9MYRT|nr:hypothetical protein MLD38_032739 [Melastoma candidum]
MNRGDSQNAGLLALTRLASRRSAGDDICRLFRDTGKFGAVFASIAPVCASLYRAFFACAGSGGQSFLQFCNLNSFRVKFVIDFSVFIGLSVLQDFKEP